ncbi:MAG: glycosyltransferase [Turicibacter sp.]|nr:glycosyltransferase [Turicibacter sp.]
MIQSLDSIFSQTVLPNEVVLVIDGPITSELKTVVDEELAKHSALKVIPLAQNGGLGKALNEGLKYCTNELIARMDTDDIAKPDRFEKQLEIYSKFQDVDVVSSWVDEFVGSPDNIISTRKLPQYQYEIFRYGKYRCPINHPSVMFKKECALFAGGYQHFPLFEDYYLWVRMLLNGAKFYNIQESLVLFRTSSDMYKRRGGIRHAIDELKFQNHIRKLGFINFGQFMFNVSVRFITRIVPNNFRKMIYQKFLRK